MAINENSSRNDSSTDSFESATLDNRSITATDCSLVDYQEEAPTFNFNKVFCQTSANFSVILFFLRSVYFSNVKKKPACFQK